MEIGDINLRHLRAILAVIESGSLSAAARLANVTQPALTQAITKLEQQLGVRLFERSARGMEATSAALPLAARAEAALDLIGSPRVSAAQMRAFVALARNGSYAAAAAATGLREASLHRAVTDLSLSLGQKLVERRGRGVGLTMRGLVLARRFRLAAAELEALLAEIAAFAGREVGRIAIGAMPLSRARLLPQALASFSRNHPEVDLVVAEGSFVELVGPLRDGELDLLVGALRDRGLGDDLIQQPLFVDRPVVLGRADHPLAGSKGQIPIARLADFPWVLPGQGTPLRSQWEQIFRDEGLEPPVVRIECGSVLVIRQLLIQTDLLTLLSTDQVALEVDSGCLTMLGAVPGDPFRTIGLTTRRGWMPTALQQSFVATLVEESAGLGSR